MNIERKTQVTVPASEYDQLEKFLMQEEAVSDAGRDEVLGCYTGKFEDGIQVDVKVVNSEDGPWSEAVFFNKRGSEIGCTEVYDTLGGLFECKVKNGFHWNIYRVIVEREASSAKICS